MAAYLELGGKLVNHLEVDGAVVEGVLELVVDVGAGLAHAGALAIPC